MTRIDGPILVDTTAVVYVARGGEAAQRIDARYGLRARSEKPLLSIVTIGEMLAFAKGRSWGTAKTERLVELARELVVVGIHHRPILEGFAEMKTFSKEQGLTIGDNDLRIAATGRATGACVLTTDRDFEPLRGTYIGCEWMDPKSLVGPPRVSDSVAAYPEHGPGGSPNGSGGRAGDG